jgi:hypothetical protein
MVMGDKQMMLPHVHSKYERYLRGEVSIFGSNEVGLVYLYIDRLNGWGQPDKLHEAVLYANTNAHVDTADWYEKVLSSFLDKDIDVKHIVASVDGHGTPYYCVGYLAP